MTNTVNTKSTLRERPSLLAVNIFLLLGILLILWLSGKSETPFPQYLMSVLAEVVLALGTLGFMRVEKLPVRETLRLYWPGWRPIVLSVVLALGLWMLGVMLNVLAALLFGYVTPVSPSTFPRDALDISLLLLATTIAAPFCEEIMFRGYVQPAYEQWGAWTGWVVSGFIFALYHLRFQGVFALLPVSFALGFVAWRSHSLLPGIVLHAVYNSVASVLLITSSFFPLDVVVVVTSVVACIGLLLIPLALLATWLFWRVTQPPPPARMQLRGGWQRWVWLVPLVILALIYGYAAIFELVLGRFPEVLAAEAITLEAPKAGETDWRLTYEVQNKLNQPVGDASCTLTNLEDEFVVTCQAQQSEFVMNLPVDMPFLDTQFSVESREWQYTASYNQETLDLLLMDGTWEAAGQTVDVTLAPTSQGGRLLITHTMQTVEDMPVAANILMEDEWPWRLAALPFDMGYGVHVPFVQIDEEGEHQVQEVYVGVQGGEPVWTPVDNFVTWKVGLTYVADTGKEVTLAAWYDTAPPHTLVRYDDGEVIYLLSEVTAIK